MQLGDEPRGSGLDVLSELGFVFGDPEIATVTALDSVDERLGVAALRLLAIESGRTELALLDGATCTREVVDRAPRIAADLPAGAVADAVTAMIGERVLTALWTTEVRRTRGEWRDLRRRLVARAEVWERAAANDLAHHRWPGSAVTIVAPRRSPQVAGVLDALRRAGAVSIDVGVVSGWIDAATTERSVRSAGMKVVLDPAADAIVGFVDVLQALATTIAANWNGAVAGDDPAFLHQLRVAVRRTRVVLAAARDVLPDDVRTEARERFVWLARATGPARDLDVHWHRRLHPVDTLEAELASAMAPIDDLLATRRLAAHRAMASALRSERAFTVVDEWIAWLHATQLAGADREAQRPLGEVVGRRVRRAHRRLVDHGRLIDGSSPDQRLHDLRVEVKRLRYLGACFSTALPSEPRREVLRSLKALQDVLGVHQDAVVRAALLESLAGELDRGQVSIETLLAIGRSIEHLHQRRRSSRADLITCFADFDSKHTRRAVRQLTTPTR